MEKYITYTDKDNMEDGVIVDKSLITTKKIDESDIETELGDSNVLLSKMKVEMYEMTLLNNKIRMTQNINNNTRDKIISLVGDETKQRNQLALYSKLQRKEAKGTISDDESVVLDNLEAMYDEVETLIANGNAKEQMVQELETIEDVRAVEID